MLDKLDGMENNDKVLLIGRVLIAAVFFFGALNWLFTMSPPIGFIASKGLPAAALLGWIALVFKLGGSVMVILGFKTRLAVLMLLVFTLITAFLFQFPDSFWPLGGTFMKELSMIGGLLVLMTTGPGKYSLDAKNGGS